MGKIFGKTNKKEISDDKKEKKNDNWGCSSKDCKNQVTGKKIKRENIDSMENFRKKENKKRKIDIDFISRGYLVTVASDMGLQMNENDLQKVIEKRVRVSCKEIIKKSTSYNQVLEASIRSCLITKCPHH